jgi:sugar/nucleoside kinase (ribokinase family)
MARDYDVLCVGLIILDLLFSPVDKSVFDKDISLVNEVNAIPGGDATNEAIILSRLGNKVGLVGKIGADNFGKIVLQMLQADQVDVQNVKVDDNDKTSVCLVLINQNGDRNFASFRGANSRFSIDDIDLSILKRTKIVNIGSMFALKMLDGAGVETIFKEARANHVITTADMKYDSYQLGFDGIKNVLKHTDFFLPSYDEAAYLTKQTNPEKMADILLATGVKTVVIKLGGEGCLIKSRQESYRIEPYKTAAVDTTGAGDNFVAGFLTGLLKNWDLRKCGMFANAVGSLSVQKVGATTSVTSMEQVMDYMDSFRVN